MGRKKWEDVTNKIINGGCYNRETIKEGHYNKMIIIGGGGR